MIKMSFVRICHAVAIQQRITKGTTMKHSTYYTHKGSMQIYTTIKHTPFHKHLRDTGNGTTYRHADSAALCFCIGMPLDKPIGGVAVGDSNAA